MHTLRITAVRTSAGHHRHRCVTFARKVGVRALAMNLGFITTEFSVESNFEGDERCDGPAKQRAAPLSVT